MGRFALLLATLVASSGTAKPIAAHCRVETVFLKWDAGGRMQLLEYTWKNPHNAGYPVPTGRIVASADSGARSINPACSPATPVVPRARDYDTANYDPGVHLEVYCNQESDAGFLIQIRPILDRKKRQIGNRLLVQDWRHRKAAPLVDARAIGPRSRIAIRVQRCFKRFWST